MKENKVIYTKEDLKDFKHRGIKQEQVNQQLENFKKGFGYVRLSEPAVIGNGIKIIPAEEENYLIDLYEKGSQKADVIKMVPVPLPECSKHYFPLWKHTKAIRKNF